MEQEPPNPYAKPPRPERPAARRRIYLVGAIVLVIAGLIAVGVVVRAIYNGAMVIHELHGGPDEDSKD